MEYISVQLNVRNNYHFNDFNFWNYWNSLLVDLKIHQIAEQQL